MEQFLSSDREIKSFDFIKNRVVEKAEQLGVPILTEQNIDEVLGDSPYLSHTIVANPEKLVSILDAGELQSSKKSGGGAMTYEGDKLIGMDTNVFLALGKGYMRQDTYALIFDPRALVRLPGVSLVEDDLMKAEEAVIQDFLEEHRKELMVAIDQNRAKLKDIFEKKVGQIFQGGYGIYGQYFGDHARDRVQDFLDAINSKGFQGIATESEVVDQFTILSDEILGEEIMPTGLREQLEKLLEERVVVPHTIVGTKNIEDAITRHWKDGHSLHQRFLPEDRHVPERVFELRVPNQLIIKAALIGIYIPNQG